MTTPAKTKNLKKQNGFSMPELLVVLLVISILVVLALPQLTASRRLFRFSGMQRQIVATLTEARQEAISQRRAITFRYDNSKKRTVIYGGSFGALGDSKNKIVEMADNGLTTAEIVYGRPSGASTAALADTSNMTALSSKMVDIVFQADGSVVDANDLPQNNALFFNNSKSPQDTAFAVSILGAGGRVKLWRYSKNLKTYVE
jgi:prepilin-type N-terminal cleavage/methylation domain-containing protein